MYITIQNRINDLREKLKVSGLDAWIIPGTDPHLSEYLPERWKEREWISGFTGSSGTVVITLESAGLWTDSRYFLQAEKELDGTGITLYKMLQPGVLAPEAWLKNELTEGDVVGVNSWVFSAERFELLEADLKPSAISVNGNYDLITEIRADLPHIPENEIYCLPVDYSGKSINEKIISLLENIEGEAINIICALDEIAWLLNLRGSDVPYNPVFISYLVISEKEKSLFCNIDMLSIDAKYSLAIAGINVSRYAEFEGYLKTIPSGTNVIIDKARCNRRIVELLHNCKIDYLPSAVNYMKSIKNEVEIEGFKEAMVLDGIALVKFKMWLENFLESHVIDEYSLGQKLHEFRKKSKNFISDSFNPIISIGSNGAIVHYSAKPNNCATIKNEGILLIDSGGQYLFGTTDITRIFALNNPSDEAKKDYTLVLKGHIGLATCRFPEGTCGVQLDILARSAMWSEGIDYGHGTGHGVGHFLNVHEGPQTIRKEGNNIKLRQGMVLTNEPGIYRKGIHGIRFENVMVVVGSGNTEFGNFLEFETITLFPVEKHLLEKTLLSEKEVNWINNYNYQVFEKLSPFLNTEETHWLKKQTEPIS